ncbi:MAG: DNA methyltransferase [Dehalococcoidales bacterium]|nr:DNA methyltransferase [Dehalococcoidales bacterium]
MSADNVTISTAFFQGEGAGSTPRPALHSIIIKPIPFVAAKTLIARHHYLHSIPAGTMLSFGIFLSNRLLGALTLGAGPAYAYNLVKDATIDDCLALTRLWLSRELPHNSASKVLGIAVRSLRQNTSVKFLVSYADPSAGHVGIVYQAAGWLYTGLSSAMPLYDLGDGKPRHSRSLAHRLGTHSVKYLRRNNLEVKLINQAAKYRYIKFLDDSWKSRLKVAVLPYPKKEEPHYEND